MASEPNPSSWECTDKYSAGCQTQMRDQWKNTHASLEESVRLTGELLNREQDLEKRRQELVSIIAAMEEKNSDKDQRELSVDSRFLDILDYAIKKDSGLKGDGKIIVVNKSGFIRFLLIGRSDVEFVFEGKRCS